MVGVGVAGVALLLGHGRTAMVAMKGVIPKTGPFFVAAFGLVDAAYFQGFLAEGLQKTSARLGSDIIDSQPLRHN